MTWLPRIAELIDGEVVVNSPSRRHQRLVTDLLHRMVTWTEASPGRGEACLGVDVKVTDADVYCPDVWWCCDERIPDIDVGKLPYLPDLVIEVLSPSTRRYDLGTKRFRYEHQGLPELWVIDPRPGANPGVRVFRRSSPDVRTFDLDLTLGVDDVLGSPQLEGFSVKMRDLLP